MAKNAEEIYSSWATLQDSGRAKKELYKQTRYINCYYCGERALTPKQCGGWYVLYSTLQVLTTPSFTGRCGSTNIVYEASSLVSYLMFS